MSKEKQMIEEMIEAIKPFVSGFACGEESGSCELTDCRTCKARNLANGIYNAGYRKQEEAVWEFHKDGSGTCSRCHHAQKAVYDDDHYQAYCGVCGSKMKGEW